ncbi:MULTISPECIES: hypothetical protein [Achromobacter]|uniref:hypothetical protein n=1 Tax=Achromobacter TaxID=222 RepID=UPI0023F92DFF|nr:hypothetical protein [Achromobacter anxifer]MDF8364674.1 hypothetical protein [Achromobacter anxifer]
MTMFGSYLRRLIWASVLALAWGAAAAHSLSATPFASRLSEPAVRVATGTAPDDFKSALAIVLNRMMTSYRTAVKEPVRIDVLDSSSANVQRFLAGVSGAAFDPHTILAVNFDANARINGQRTAACMVRFNNERRAELLSGYERSGIFSRADTVYYLAAHEFGHCMAFHQESLGRRLGLSDKGHETMADKVAIAFFMVNGKPEAARRIVEFNRRLVVDHIHSHPEELEVFIAQMESLLEGQAPQALASSMLDIFNLAVADTPAARR